jgi:hypothetical protein
MQEKYLKAHTAECCKGFKYSFSYTKLHNIANAVNSKITLFTFSQKNYGLGCSES